LSAAELDAHSVDIRQLAYQEIKKTIKKHSTRYTAKTAFQTIEAKIARLWLSPDDDSRSLNKVVLTSDGGEDYQMERVSQGTGAENNQLDSDSPPVLPHKNGDSEVEAAARRTLDDLGFMFRAPITVMTTITWTLGAPIWVFTTKSHTYHLSMDAIHQQYKQLIVQPWVESLRGEGEKTLLGTISLSSNAARNSLNGALEREKTRYKRELETKRNPPDDKMVENLVTAYINLLAAEEALQELNGRIGRE
jgi:hypothetical protein